MSGFAQQKTEMDATVQLPDEVLSHVFSFLSLSDKLRSESVNRKFQRCVRDELSANPQPLELDLEHQLLNGYKVPLTKYSRAVEALAKRAKFSRVEIERVGGTRIVERVDSLLSLLISHSQCLSRVTTFVTFGGCSQAVLKSFLDKCAKVSTVKLKFDARPPLNSHQDDSVFPLDFRDVFKNKRLTELHLCPFRYPQKCLAQAFKAIEPNSLRKLTLVFNHEMLVNMVQLVDALSPLGSTLEQMRLDFYEVDVQLADLFQSLDRLPALRKCDIDCTMIEPEDQFVAVATSLFMKSEIEIEVGANDLSLFSPDLPGCQIVDMISQIQNVHPSLVVDFDQYGSSLILKLDKATIQKTFSMEGVGVCDAEDCVQCQSFYPSLLGFLRAEAQDAASHFEDAPIFLDLKVDRCRVDKIVDDLSSGPDTELWKPLSVEFNEDQQSVTRGCQTVWNMVPHPFNITVGCGHCLTNGCMKCVN